MPKLILALLALPFASFAAAPVQLHWLDGAPPAAGEGVTWGVPWAKGELHASDSLALTTTAGKSIPVQTWPIAYWPDGSVKWTAQSIAADATVSGELQLAVGTAAVPATPLRVTDSTAAIEVDTGTFCVRVPKHGTAIIESITMGDRIVAQNGRLIAHLERPAADATHATTEIAFVGEIDQAVVEQAGPVRAIVKVTGRHRSASGNRAWLPYTVRLELFASSRAIRLTHSFVYDGDPSRDFISALGIAFEVPFREELHNRHIRFAGDLDGGMWNQPVRMLPGYRAQTGQGITDLYDENLAGQRIANVDQLDARSRNALLTVPVWADAKLMQLSPNGWSIYKRTSPQASWLHVTDGHRTRGFALLGDVSGALAIGTKDFWQKAPASLEITGAAGKAGELKVWFWSPDAPAMDLRRYDDVPHGLAVNYEDWKPGWGTPIGIANTHDVTLWVLNSVPPDDQLVAMAKLAAEPPLLVCTPEYYHRQQVFGYWSLPDRSTPAASWVEDQIQGLVDYYHGQVDERSWYGFWDFGDIMHNYDFGRHQWRYDVGGWAWANTELMPDMLLWYSFLRTGRADIFRFAAAMTRHTSEVDVHHVGPFAPLGSRHNVNHWGDGAKQPRISHAGLKRFYYFLTGGDGRVGDLLREQIDADLTFNYLQQFNNSHYVLDAAGNPELDRRANPFMPQAAARTPAPRPEDFAPRQSAAQRQPYTRFGLEWMCYALNWTTEWERGGDQTWRGRVESEMKAMAEKVDQQGRFPGRYFDMIFGGPENMWEMERMYDVPEFWRAWVNTCESIGRQVDGSQMTGPRMLAYAAYKKNDAELGRLAWEKLIGPPGKLPPTAEPKRYAGADIAHPVTDPAFLGASVGWQLHGVASVQWALNAIETLELAKKYLPEWEKARSP